MGSSFPRMTLRSSPASVMAASLTTPPEDPSLSIARAKAEEKGEKRATRER